MENSIKVIHRKYDGWEFRALQLTSTQFDRITNIVYGKSDSVKGNDVLSIELYRGENYITGNKERSWSRCYKNIESLPKQYLSLVKLLKEKHETIKWNNNTIKLNN